IRTTHTVSTVTTVSSRPPTGTVPVAAGSISSTRAICPEGGNSKPSTVTAWGVRLTTVASMLLYIVLLLLGWLFLAVCLAALGHPQLQVWGRPGEVSPAS